MGGGWAGRGPAVLAVSHSGWRRDGHPATVVTYNNYLHLSLPLLPLATPKERKEISSRYTHSLIPGRFHHSHM